MTDQENNPYAPTGESQPQDRPMWVLLGLWGLPNRASVWVFFWISIALAVGGVVGSFWNPILLVGIGFVFAALWYWAALKWVDHHGGWPR